MNNPLFRTSKYSIDMDTSVLEIQEEKWNQPGMADKRQLELKAQLISIIDQVPEVQAIRAQCAVIGHSGLGRHFRDSPLLTCQYCGQQYDEPTLGSSGYSRATLSDLANEWNADTSPEGTV